MWIDGKGWLSLDGMVDSRASNLWMESTSVSFEKARYSNREVVLSCSLCRRPYGCVILGPVEDAGYRNEGRICVCASRWCKDCEPAQRRRGSIPLFIFSLRKSRAALSWNCALTKSLKPYYYNIPAYMVESLNKLLNSPPYSPSNDGQWLPPVRPSCRFAMKRQ